jgi:hypothetical protein
MATSGATNAKTAVGDSGVAEPDSGHRRIEDRVQGFVAPTAGELSGRVVDAGGHSIANATVHLVEPARNRDDKPMVSLVLWKFECPPTGG